MVHRLKHGKVVRDMLLYSTLRVIQPGPAIQIGKFISAPLA
jgi:hypothetical protein